MTSTEESISQNITLFPNPAQDHVLLTLHDLVPKDGAILIYDTRGNLVKRQSVYFGWNDLQLLDLTQGLYIYEITDGDRLLKSGKIVKE